MRLDEYASLDGLAIADLVRRKEIARSEPARLAREAMAALNPRLNFLAGETPELAQRALDAPAGVGAFDGVPFLIKDIGAAIAGVPQEMGCTLAAGLTPAQDSELTLRQRKAGFVTLGRTATPELGSSFATESRANGPTRNPWNTNLSPGGSSGGAAVAVVTGVVPIAHGGDSAGSIRIPAHCCGVFGLKPTRGRNPVGPGAAEVNSGLTAGHVLTRSVRDSAAALDATAGSDSGAPYAAAPPPGSFLSAITARPRTLRIAVSTHSPLTDHVSPEVAAAARDAARLCERLGHTVVEDGPAFDAEDFLQTLLTVWCCHIHHAVAKLEIATGRQGGPDNLENATWAMAQHGRNLSADAFLSALDHVNDRTRAFGRFFERYDILITPTLATPAFALGALSADVAVPDVFQYLARTFAVAPFTAQWNMTGQPAMSVPLHQSGDGLPIGTQFVGRYGAEETLFSLAGQLEAALPWAQRHPPIGIFS